MRYDFELLEMFLHCRRGATAVEYSILAGGIALSIFVILMLVGADLSDIMNVLGGAIETAVDEVEE